MLIVRRRRSRAERCRGAEVLEFTFVFLPMMAMIILLIDVAWAVFVKATLEYAVRAESVRASRLPAARHRLPGPT